MKQDIKLTKKEIEAVLKAARKVYRGEYLASCGAIGTTGGDPLRHKYATFFNKDSWLRWFPEHEYHSSLATKRVKEQRLLMPLTFIEVCK